MAEDPCRSDYQQIDSSGLNISPAECQLITAGRVCCGPAGPPYCLSVYFPLWKPGWAEGLVRDQNPTSLFNTRRNRHTVQGISVLETEMKISIPANLSVGFCGQPLQHDWHTAQPCGHAHFLNVSLPQSVAMVTATIGQIWQLNQPIGRHPRQIQMTTVKRFKGLRWLHSDVNVLVRVEITGEEYLFHWWQKLSSYILGHILQTVTRL